MRLLTVCSVLVAALPSVLTAADRDPEDYRIRLSGAAWFGKATGNINYNGDTIDLDRDIGLGSATSPVVGIDFKPFRKHHFFIDLAFRDVSNERTLVRDITFNGQTYQVGTGITTDLQWNTYAFGYQYDVVRRRWGHIGIAAQLNLIDMRAQIATVTGVSGAGATSTVQGTTEGSVLAPLPILGPDVRLYLVPGRVFVDANAKGMYFFGYGNYIEGHAGLGINLTHNLSLTGGYLVEGRTTIHGQSDRLGVSARQQGAVAGLEVRF